MEIQVKSAIFFILLGPQFPVNRISATAPNNNTTGVLSGEYCMKCGKYCGGGLNHHCGQTVTTSWKKLTCVCDYFIVGTVGFADEDVLSAACTDECDHAPPLFSCSAVTCDCFCDNPSAATASGIYGSGQMIFTFSCLSTVTALSFIFRRL